MDEKNSNELVAYVMTVIEEMNPITTREIKLILEKLGKNYEFSMIKWAVENLKRRDFVSIGYQPRNIEGEEVLTTVYFPAKSKNKPDTELARLKNILPKRREIKRIVKEILDSER